MKLWNSLTCALLLSCVPASILQRRSFAFDLHPTNRHHKNNLAISSTAGKPSLWSRNMTARSRKLRSTDGSFLVEIVDFQNMEYHLTVQIGTPCKSPLDIQSFRVVPDTGSADLWVPGVRCRWCPAMARRFNATKSCSAKPLGILGNVTYGDGTKASGNTFEDRIMMGKITIRSQPILEVDYMSDNATMYSDGILGLGHYYADLAATKEQSFLQRLISEHKEMPPMFSFALSPDVTGSKIIFGHPDVGTYAKEPLTYGRAYYMTHTKLWLTTVYSVGFAHTGVERRFASSGLLGAPAMVDSGSSFIILIPSIWNILMPEVTRFLQNCTRSNPRNTMRCTCPSQSVYDKMPELVINLIDENEEEHPLCMGPEEYILRQFDRNTQSYWCTPVLERGTAVQPFPVVLGLAFMRTFYTNFDIARRQIGFARSKYSYLPASSFCSVRTAIQMKLWMVAIPMASLAVAFALYACCCGDVNACCGWPTCKASDPCACPQTYVPMQKMAMVENMNATMTAEEVEDRLKGGDDELLCL